MPLSNMLATLRSWPHAGLVKRDLSSTHVCRCPCRPPACSHHSALFPFPLLPARHVSCQQWSPMCGTSCRPPSARSACAGMTYTWAGSRVGGIDYVQCLGPLAAWEPACWPVQFVVWCFATCAARAAMTTCVASIACHPCLPVQPSESQAVTEERAVAPGTGADQSYRPASPPSADLVRPLCTSKHPTWHAMQLQLKPSMPATCPLAH